MPPTQWVVWADFIASLITLLGVPTAIYVYWRNRRWERRQREVEAHAAAHQRYADYLALSLDHPSVDAFEYQEGEEEAAEIGLPVPKITMFTILISTMETAYLQYRYQPSAILQSQWLGWAEYIQWWFRRSDFDKAWPILSQQFHRDFREVGDRLRSGEDPKQVVGT